MRKKGLFAAAAAFAASPQGRRMLGQAKDYFRSPEGQRKIADLKSQVNTQVSKRRTTKTP